MAFHERARGHPVPAHLGTRNNFYLQDRLKMGIQLSHLASPKPPNFKVTENHCNNHRI